MSTDCLRTLATGLRALAQDLSRIEQRLARIAWREENGGDVSIRCTCRLSDGARFSGQDIRDAADALARASRHLGVACRDSAVTLRNAADLFDETEQRIADSFLRLGDGSDQRTVISLAFAARDPLIGGGTFRPDFWRPMDEIRQWAAEKLAEKQRERAALRREYEEILRSPDPASNPRIYEIIDARLEDSGFSQRHRELVVNSVQNAPQDFQDIYLHSFYQYDIQSGAAHGYSGAYVPTDNTMYVDSTAFATEESFLDTYFHETGHAIDRNAGNLSTSTRLLRHITTDTENYINSKIDIYSDGLTPVEKSHVLQAFMSGDARETSTNWLGKPTGYPPADLNSAEKQVYRKVVQACDAELRNTSYESDCMPWDIINGMTNNTLSSCGGHRKDYAGEHYWFDTDGNRTGNECSEAWAEYYSSMMTGDVDSQSDNTAYLPNASDYMSLIAQGAAQRYRGQPSVLNHMSASSAATAHAPR